MSRTGIAGVIRFLLTLLLALAALRAIAPAQQPVGAGTTGTPVQPATVAPAPTPKTTLADFAWLVGRWQGNWGPRVAQQAWMPPQAGVMLGTFQLVENDKTLVLELFTLVETPAGIEFHIRHFTPSLAVWEKTSSTVLNLASADPKTIIFENPIDGQPKHSIFKRTDADTYVARSEIVPEKGDMQVIEITYHRQTDGVPAKRHGKKPQAAN
ncbi:MAG: DUF6265 family protein [Candidatus Acidiferrales bacterium]|jgi:uncharacterized protein DUF6265